MKKSLEFHDEQCKFCLCPINIDAPDIIKPCKCETKVNCPLPDRMYAYCHERCLIEYRIQRSDNNCYIRCEDCKSMYVFVVRNMSCWDKFIYYLTANMLMQTIMNMIWFTIYMALWTAPIFGFMILWRFTNNQSFSNLLADENINMGSWFPYYLLGSLTWATILLLYWMLFASGSCCAPVHCHSQYHSGYRGYYGSCYGGGYYPVFFVGGYGHHGGHHGGGGGCCGGGCCGDGGDDSKAMLIVAVVLLIIAAILLALVLIYICYELTNLRYKQALKRSLAIKYKVKGKVLNDQKLPWNTLNDLEQPPKYQSPPSAPLYPAEPPPGYNFDADETPASAPSAYDCGFKCHI